MYKASVEDIFPAFPGVVYFATGFSNFLRFSFETGKKKRRWVAPAFTCQLIKPILLLRHFHSGVGQLRLNLHHFV
jgi:hypothetical protein